MADFLAALPPERKQAVAATRALVRQHVPKGYQEHMNWGAINWSVPLSKLPDTYNHQPLTYVALGSHKSYVTLYLMMAYGDPKKAAWLKDQFAKAGKKMDMGKSCLHFKTLDDLPVDAIGTLIESFTPDQWIAIYRKSRAASALRGGRSSRSLR